MGNSLTASKFERRNSVIRRSQRKSVLSVKSRIENVFKDIKRMKSIEEDEQYNKIKAKIEEYEKDLLKKSKDLQPQLRGISNETQIKIKKAEALLVEKLKENQEKAEKKKREAEEKRKEKGEVEEQTEHGESDEILEELERQRDAGVHRDSELTQEENNLENSTEKRQTVQLQLIKVESPLLPNNHITDGLARNDEKRRSIMKMGVQVFPSVPGGILRNSSNSSKHVEIQEDSDVVAKRIEREHEEQIFGSEEWLEKLKIDVQKTEEAISVFIGNKNGLHYNKLKEKLFHYLDVLNSREFKDNEGTEQLKRYVNSCFSFLDEKAVDEGDEDDVFIPDGGSRLTQNGFKVTSI